MADTGLLVTMTFMDRAFTDNELYRAILFDKLDINEGMIMENIVAQMLRRNGHKPYFYSRSDPEHRENHMEIDFLITQGGKIAPIEVKSADYRAHSSLDKFRNRCYRIQRSYRATKHCTLSCNGAAKCRKIWIIPPLDFGLFPW